MEGLLAEDLTGEKVEGESAHKKALRLDEQFAGTIPYYRLGPQV